MNNLISKTSRNLGDATIIFLIIFLIILYLFVIEERKKEFYIILYAYIYLSKLFYLVKSTIPSPQINILIILWFNTSVEV